MKKNKKKGFTLVELLVTIFIIGLVLGIGSYIVTNVIKNSENKSVVITQENVKKSANSYAKEYMNKIVWQGNEGCVSVEELVSKGYLKKDILEKITSKNIVITKDNNNNILSEKEETDNRCQDIKENKVPILKNSDLCNDELNYTGSQLNLLDDGKLEALNYLEVAPDNITMATDVGSYPITINLKKDENGNTQYIWKDNTTEPKQIMCTIQKKIIDVKISPKRQDASVIGTESITLITDAPGDIEIKISSPNYVKATIKSELNGTPETGYEGTIEVTNSAERSTNSYVTITVNPKPEDENKYQKSTAIYTIGKIDKNKIPIPTTELCNLDAYYIDNSTEVCLVKEKNLCSSDETTRLTAEANFIKAYGYLLTGVTSKTIGENIITATLPGGSKWDDGTTDVKTFTCKLFNKFKNHYLGNGSTSQTYNLTTECNSSDQCGLDRYAEGSVYDSTNKIFKHAKAYKLNTSMTLLANKFKKTGHTFKGWIGENGKTYLDKEKIKLPYEESSIVDDGIFTLTANWSINKYKITFDCNGGKETSSSITKNYNTVINLGDKSCTRTGYTLSGWSTSATGSKNYEKNDSIKVTKDLKLYAIWNANTYKVKYYKNHNNATGSMADTTHTYDVSKALRTNAFTRTGYTFSGWSKTTDGDVKYKDKASVKNLTSTNGATVDLYAIWEIKQYKITFNCNGGTGSTASITKNYNTKANLTNNGCTRTGYRFAGWSTSKSGDVVYKNKAEVTFTKDLTLYAIWNPNTYVIHYYGNGSDSQTYTSSNSCNDDNKCGLDRFTSGTTYDSTNKIFKHATVRKYGTSFDLAKNRYSKDHYNFAGWATSSSGSVAYDNQESVKNLTSTNNGTVKLYAKWTKKKYTIKFSCNGGSGSTPSITKSYNTTANLPAEGCSRSGYTFIGWAKSSGGSVVYKNKASVTFTSSFTLYAKWSDQTKPKCSTSKSSKYSPSGVTVKVTCSDAGSGCSSGYGTFTGVKSSKTYTVKDAAGNKGTCSVTVSSRKRYRKRYRTYDSCKTGKKWYEGTCRVQYADGIGGKQFYSQKVKGTTATKCKNACPKSYGVLLGGKCTYKNTCKGGYTAWGSWGSYVYSSCTETTTTDCSYRTEYY